MASESDSAEVGAHDRPRRPVSWPVVGFLVIVCPLLALYVQFPYRQAVHHNDEMYMLLESGLVRTGHHGFFAWLFRPYSGHQFIGWKLLYNLELSLFGLDPEPWHLVVCLFHASSALIVYAYLRRFLDGQLGPVVGALVWSGAAIGHWDNPLIWPAAACMSFSIGLLLAALFCADNMRTSPSRRWDVLLFLSVTASVVIWSVAWILMLLIPLQQLLISGDNWRAALKRLKWSWQLPFAVLGLLQLNSTMPEAMASVSESHSLVWNVAYRTAAQLATTFSLLTFWNIDQPPTVGLPLKLTMVASFFAVTLLINLRHWRWIVVVTTFSLLYLVGVNVSRAGIPLEVALSWGRYAYLPMLTWSLLLGIFVHGVSSRLRGWPSRGFGLLSIVVVSFYAFHQRQLAESTAREYRVVSGPAYAQRESNNEVLRAISELAVRLGTPVRLPEIPVNVPPVDRVIFPLSAYMNIWFPDGLPNIELVATEDWDIKDRKQVFGLLDSLARPDARIWGEALLALDQLDRQLTWLEALAKRQGVILRVPDREVSLMGLRFRVSQFVAASYSEAAMSSLFQVPPPEWSPADKELVLETLQNSTGPEAEFWTEYIQSQTPASGRENR